MVSEEPVINLRKEDVRSLVASLFQGKDDVERLINKRRKSRRPNTRVLSTKHRRAPKLAPKKRPSRGTETSDAAPETTFSGNEITVDTSQPGHSTERSSNKRAKFPKKILKRVGKRLEWLLKKGAKYIGIGIIKIFDNPVAAYTPDSRINIC